MTDKRITRIPKVPTGAKRKSHLVALDAADAEYARKLGGNLTQGIRIALQNHRAKEQRD